MKNNKLKRSSTNRVSYGILGGIAERYNFDPTLLRIIFSVLMVLTLNFALVLLYIVTIFIIPKDNEL